MISSDHLVGVPKLRHYKYYVLKPPKTTVCYGAGIGDYLLGPVDDYYHAMLIASMAYENSLMKVSPYISVTARLLIILVEFNKQTWNAHSFNPNRHFV